MLARLLIALLICIFAAPTLVSILNFPGGASTAKPLVFYCLAAASVVFSSAALVLTLRPWTLERFTLRLVILCLCFLASLNLSAWVQRLANARPAASASIWSVVIATLSFQGAALILIHWFVRQHQSTWREAFGLTRRGAGWAVLLGVALAVVAVPAGMALQEGCTWLLTRLHFEAKEQRIVEILQSTGFWPAQTYLVFTAVILAPLAEEALFRGILYTAIKQHGYPRTALWGTSVLFAAVHGNLPSFLPLALLAAALALLYDRTGHLLAPIAAHSCFNALNALMLFVAPRFGLNG